MTLDPVHFEGIVRLAERIRPRLDTGEHQRLAETVWAAFLEPLYHDGVRVIEPLEECRRRSADPEAIALESDPFPTQHGLDSGTMNPTTFRNGLVVDVAQAAMSAVPSDLDLHRARTLVATVHANDVTVDVETDEWLMDDAGYTRQRIIQAPRLDRFERHVVHVLALYLAESQHALSQADVVDDLLFLDGPLYPTGLLEWVGRESRLADLVVEAAHPRDVVTNYLRLVERFVDRDVPLVGFVKAPNARTITRAVRADRGNVPWLDDSAFFRRVLDPRSDGEGDDRLTFTDWFVSRGGTDRILSTAGDAFGLDRRLGAAAYEVTFFMVYDPRADLLYRVEAPYAFTRDERRREALTRQVVGDVALQRGPPLAVGKADELARISREETAALHRAFERAFDSDRDRDYNDHRWGLEFADF